MKTLVEYSEADISKILRSGIVVFSPNDQVSKVLGVLKDTGSYEAVVIEGDRSGIVTVRDLMGVDQPARTKLDRVWRQTGSVKSKSRVLDTAVQLVENNVRALPVIDGRDLIGIISQNDLAEAIINVSELKTLWAKNIISSPVFTLDVDGGVAQARRIMLDKGISHIPVIKDDKLVGIVTAENLVHTFVTPVSKTTRGDVGGEKVNRFQGKVSGIMNTDPFTVNPEANTLTVARGLMGSPNGACIMVDEEQHVIGIITPKELVKLVSNLKAQDPLPIYILGISDEDFFERAVAEDKVRRVINKSLKIHPNITEVSIRVKKQNKQGERSRYLITGRAIGPSTTYNAENEGWGLMETFDGFVDVLDRALKKAKSEPQKGSRHGRRRPKPNNRP